MADDSGQPGRLTTPEVLALARYRIGTLRRRIAEGRMPGPIDRCGSGGVYDKQAVMAALGLASAPGVVEPATRRVLTAEEFAIARAKLSEEYRRKAYVKKLIERPHPPTIQKAVKPPPGPFGSPTAKRDGRQTPNQPSDLGRYVVMKKRADGCFAVYFQVPKRLRPKGWKPTILLPIDEPRTGSMRNRSEIARIREDARQLYASMTRERLAQARQARDAGEME